MPIRKWSLVIAAILLVGPRLATAEGPTPGAMQTGSLLMRMSDGYVTAPLLNTDVNITVNGLVARVSVMQEFENVGQEWVEGVYVFPLPDEAAVDHMRLYIGDRFIEGEIREKEQARKEYEQAKSEGKKTSLVEQQRTNLFTTSVANIAPGEKVIVEIEYLENLRYDNGTFSLRFPMTLTPRYVPGQALPDTTLDDDGSLLTPPMASPSRGHRISLQATVNAGMPLEIIASRYHAVNVSESHGQYLISLAGGQVPMDHDFEILWRPVPAAEPRAMVFTETISGEPHYLLMVVPPEPELVSATQMLREMIFIVDTSGSMHGVSIAQAKQALQRAISGLRPGDKFNIIEFNSHANRLFAHSVIANQANTNVAQNFVRGLSANGGTEMYPALNLALRSPPSDAYLRQVIFITDGAVGNEEALFRLIGEKLQGARLFTVGIGSAPNSWFMHKAAEVGRGTFTIISALHEVGEKMDRLFRKLESPQVTDIDVQWPSGVIVDSYPGVVPDLYLGEPVTVKARVSGAVLAGAVVRITGNSVGGAWTSELALTGKTQSAGVAALWARARIADLLDQQRRGANKDETRAAAMETALAHHLVSKYTSLVAVDRTPARPAGAGLASGQVASRMPYGQGGGAMIGFPATATNAEVLRLTGLAALLAALLLMALPAFERKESHELVH